MDFDDVLRTVGPFGRYQKLTLFLVLLPALLPDGILVLNGVFMAATPADYWCKVPGSNKVTRDDLFTALPKMVKDKESRHSRCTMYAADYPNLTRDDLLALQNSSLSEVSCRYGNEFDRSTYENTIVTEFNLVCEKHLLATASFTYFTLGGLFGPILWGLIADRFGRKNGFYACVTFQSIFSITTSFAPNYTLYCVFRLLVGMTTSASYSLPLLMGFELTGPQTRAMISVLCSAAYTSGCIILWGIAYYIRQWRMLSLATSIPLVVVYIVLWKFFPESPRWLLSNGRYEQLETQLLKIARVNGKVLPPEFTDSLPKVLREMDTENHNIKHSIIDVLKYPNLLKKTAILVFVNFCNKGVFMGLNYYAPGFGTDPHWSFLLANLIEFPPYIFAQYLCDHLGRRPSLFLGMCLGSLSCLLVGISDGSGSSMTFVITLCLFGKFCITFTYLISELLEGETFPTVIRSEGNSLTSMVSSLAGCITPFIVHLGHNYVVLPLLIYGSCCCFAAITVLFLPETMNQDLPETLEDGENFGKNMRWRDVFRLRLPSPKREGKGCLEENFELNDNSL